MCKEETLGHGGVAVGRFHLGASLVYDPPQVCLVKGGVYMCAEGSRATSNKQLKVESGEVRRVVVII